LSSSSFPAYKVTGQKESETEREIKRKRR